MLQLFVSLLRVWLFCLPLLNFDYFWVNHSSFQNPALVIVLERGRAAQSGLCGRLHLHFKCNSTWEDCVILLENCVGRNQRGPVVWLPRVFAAYWSSVLTSTCYTFQKWWHLATLWTSVVNCWQRFLHCNLMWSFANRCICMWEIVFSHAWLTNAI